MALNLIDHAPVIDQDHPLFSWDDFPQSRDSLVSGTPVSLFEADCWDAMVWKVDYIANMMDFSFSGLPYFSEKWNKEFEADMYNRMLYALTILWPAWYDASKYAVKKGDPLEPWRLRFVANWVNDVIKVARGTTVLLRPELYRHSYTRTSFFLEAWESIRFEPFAMATATAKSDIELLPSAPIGDTAKSCFSNTVFDLLVRDSVQIETKLKMKTKRQVEAGKLPSAPMRPRAYGKSRSNVSILMTSLSRFYVYEHLRTVINAAVTPLEPAACDISFTGNGYSKAEVLAQESLLACVDEILKSSSTPKANVVKSLLAGGATTLGASKIIADVSANSSVGVMDIKKSGRSFPLPRFTCCNSAKVDTYSYDFSNVEVPAHVCDAAVSGTTLDLHTDSYVNLITQTTRPGWTSAVSRGITSAEVEHLEARNVVADHSSNAKTGCTLELISAANVETNTLASGTATCEAAVFLLPLRPDSKTLHIRQTYQDALKLDNMLYIDQWPDQGLTDEGTLFLWHVYDTLMQVGNTLYIGSIPDTGMVGSDTLLIWDVEQEPVKTLTLLEVF